MKFHALIRLFLSLLVMLVPPAFAQQKRPTPVFVQQVDVQTMSETIEALGTLRANEATVISSSVTETITVIHFDDNQHVSAGEVLVEMTSEEEHAQLEQAKSALDEAQRQYARLQTLQKDRLTTESELDQQKAALESAAAQLRGVQSRLQDRLILAPFDGVVGLRNISVGALVRPGDVITTLDDIRVMKLDMTVPSVHLDKIQTGMEVVAKASAYKGTEFRGTLASIGSRVDPVTRSVTARALIPNADALLRPGLLMTVQLKEQGRDAIAIAEEAIIQVGRTSFVYVVDSGAEPKLVEKRQVQLGLRQQGLVEITSGLQQGELLVVHGGMKLRPGSEVTISATRKQGERLPDLLTQ
ncbi:membrane fusion protein, multidrug efflux system [Alteromonadaceae bacterium Bs31]|nr:membrane fusion protein, multidrug efflux system [Alteromonadaceae bacterium Bs31]